MRVRCTILTLVGRGDFPTPFLLLLLTSRPEGDGKSWSILLLWTEDNGQGLTIDIFNHFHVLELKIEIIFQCEGMFSAFTKIPTIEALKHPACHKRRTEYLLWRGWLRDRCLSLAESSFPLRRDDLWRGTRDARSRSDRHLLPTHRKLPEKKKRKKQKKWLISEFFNLTKVGHLLSQLFGLKQVLQIP